MFQPNLFLVLILMLSFSHYSFAWTETLSEIGDTVVKGTKELGNKAVAVGKDAGTYAGIGATAKEIDHDSSVALDTLLKQTPAAADLYKKAKGVLIYPRILKAGLGLGGQHGKGVLREKGKSTGYYDTVAVSYGLQAGGQSFGYAMFFMDDESLDYLLQSKGWELGVGPSFVIVDEGMAKNLTTTTIKDSIYVFVFSQKGLMAGVGLQGSKISKIYPK